MLDFPMRKPSLKGVLIMIVIGALAVGVVVIYGILNVPDHKDETNPIVEEIKHSNTVSDGEDLTSSEVLGGVENNESQIA